MNKVLLAPLVAATALAGGCASTGYGYDDGYRGGGGGGWYADDHYRDGNYRERRLGRNDRVYRGRDGRYYCKRSDGTTRSEEHTSELQSLMRISYAVFCLKKKKKKKSKTHKPHIQTANTTV